MKDLQTPFYPLVNNNLSRINYLGQYSNNPQSCEIMITTPVGSQLLLIEELRIFGDFLSKQNRLGWYLSPNLFESVEGRSGRARADLQRPRP